MSGMPAGRGGKSRIVIDVDKLKQESSARVRRRGRGRMILSITALVVVALITAVLLGGYLWWRSYTKSPTYSVALLLDAAQRDDVRAVEELLDADRVAAGFVPQVVEKLAGNAGANPAVLQQQTAALAPQLTPRLREGVRDEVARGVKAMAEKTGGNLPFILLAAGLRRYADVKEDGDRAAVSLNVEGRAVGLQMQRNSDRWKIVEIKDDALAASLAARVAPNIPSARPAAATPTPARQPRRKP